MKTDLTIYEPPTGFDENQRKLLGDKLNPEHLKQRSQSGQTFSYIEGWRVIERANAVFDYDGWDRQTLNLQCVVDTTYPKTDFKTKKVVTDADGNPVLMHRVGYRATVRVTVRAGKRAVIREGSGFGQGTGQDPNIAHEGAIKEAETDAMKRALVTFGDQFGLTLYDKDQSNVSTPDYVLAAESHAISSVQLQTLRDLISTTGTDEEKFCGFLKISALESLTVANFERARTLLLQKRKASKRPCRRLRFSATSSKGRRSGSTSEPGLSQLQLQSVC